jgi:hypothetical protein
MLCLCVQVEATAAELQSMMGLTLNCMNKSQQWRQAVSCNWVIATVYAGLAATTA